MNWTDQLMIAMNPSAGGSTDRGWFKDAAFINNLDSETANALRGIDFSSAANAGVNINQLFEGLIQRGAKPEQILGFGRMLAGGEYAGQFGKYAQGETINKNIDAYMGGQTDPMKMGSDTGSGGWLQHHGGDIINWATNPIDAATGNRISGELGRLGGRMYDNTFGDVGGWLGENVFGENGMAAPYTRHVMNMTAGGVMPGAASGYRADYANARQRGMTPAQANRALGQSAATSATALVGGGLLNGLGAATSAGGSPLAAIGSTGTRLGDAAVRGAVMSGAQGGIGTAVSGGDLEDILRGVGVGAATGAVSGGVGSGVGGAAGGGALGSILGRTAGGLAGGATSSALRGGSGADILAGAELGGVGGLANSAVGGLTGSPTLGGMAGNLARGALAPSVVPNQPQTVNNQTSSKELDMPTGSNIGDMPLTMGGGYGEPGVGNLPDTMGGGAPDMSIAGDQAGGGGGFNLGDFLSQLFGTGATTAVDLSNAAALRRAGNEAATMADPWAPNRQRYMDQLNGLMSDPSSIANMPGYQFRLQQGNEQINRNMAATGGVGSGQQLAELMKYGSGLASQEYGAEEQRLVELAGVNAGSPVAAGSLYMDGQIGSTDLIGQTARGGADSLFGPGGLLSQGVNGLSGLLQRLFSGGGGGGGGAGAAGGGQVPYAALANMLHNIPYQYGGTGDYQSPLGEGTPYDLSGGGGILDFGDFLGGGMGGGFQNDDGSLLGGNDGSIDFGGYGVADPGLDYGALFGSDDPYGLFFDDGGP